MRSYTPLATLAISNYATLVSAQYSTQMSYDVEVQYTSSATLETNGFTRSFTKDDYFTQQYNEYSYSYNVGVNAGKISFGFSDAMQKISDTALDLRHDGEDTDSSQSVMQPGQYQVWRQVTTDVVLDGQKMSSVENEYVYNTPNMPTTEELDAGATEFLNMYLLPVGSEPVTKPELSVTYEAFLQEELIYLEDGICVTTTVGDGNDATSDCLVNFFVQLVDHEPAYNITAGPFSDKSQTQQFCTKQGDFVKSTVINSLVIQHQPGCSGALQFAANGVSVDVDGDSSVWTLSDFADDDGVWWMTAAAGTNGSGNQCGSAQFCRMAWVSGADPASAQ